ncbi:PGAP1-like alpha/beta domain-containing protein [Massilia yuzhufengensis]|uniref:PGAP1-like protein n=1 Tax=Massilia yuzhufengensis TaxID=1164594 RepID=A0A1I1U607_9BURK|nr:alpha/beta fold hydrolase [Massilia yuzhufengensis]SFD66301.1 PGAP1-like protein [Massilia yuzhufengensis]
MGEPTRPLPPLVPLANGGWEVNSFLSSAEYTIRGLGLMPPNTIVPVIVVPGIMGTNLRAKRKPILGKQQDERNAILSPGAAAWRPPNGNQDGARAALKWDKISPRDRQKLFNPATLEVDDSGTVVLPDTEDGYVLTEAEVRQRGWGEVHADSYGILLHALQTRLNQTFGSDDQTKRRFVQPHWKQVMSFEATRWGVREFAALTEAQLEKHATQYYPVYAVGYNWLEDCDTSSRHLEKRIREIMDSWRKSKRRCEKVILITHSMGGFVARACAKRIPEKIAGVIHGVMPALGAPAAYRRIACGTESSSPSNEGFEHLSALGIAKILGATPDKTTPVLATAPGALELLPNHLYPGPWLHVRVAKVRNPQHVSNRDARMNSQSGDIATDYLKLPSQIAPNPYDLYRDTRCWYRLIDLKLADPARRFREPTDLTRAIRAAIDTAERFHRTLGDYYHPNTYVFYGDDQNKRSYGQMRWLARQWGGSPIALTTSNIAAGELVGRPSGWNRRVLVEGRVELQFEPEPQDTRGDGTVPKQSGAGPSGRVKQIFATQGFDHQGSYNNDDMLMLTLRLIVKIVQEMS